MKDFFPIQLLIAYGSGLLASLTPCVYPLLPITVGIIGSLEDQKTSFWHNLFRLLSYVFGISLMYSLLGILAALTGKIFGSFTQSSWAYLLVGSVFVFSSLFLLKEWSLPRLWKKRKRKKNFSSPSSLELSGLFFLGLSSGLVAAPCTTPFLTATLSWVAQTQSVMQGFFLMLSFSFGMFTLLILAGLFTHFLEQLPRSGKWLSWVKNFSALLLLAAGLYFVYQAGYLRGIHT